MIAITDDIPTKELIEAHNAAQEMLGGRTVTKFENREAAVRRTREVIARITDPAKRPGRFREEEVVKEAKTKKERAPKAPKEPKEKAPRATFQIGGLDWHCGTATNRARLISELMEHRNSYVPLRQMREALYGEDSGDKTPGAVGGVLRGIEFLIQKYELPVRLESKRVSKDGTEEGPTEVAYGLIDAD